MNIQTNINTITNMCMYYIFIPVYISFLVQYIDDIDIDYIYGTFTTM